MRGGSILCHGWASPRDVREKGLYRAGSSLRGRVASDRLRFKAIRQEPKRLGHFAWIRSETCSPRGAGSINTCAVRCPNQSPFSLLYFSTQRKSTKWKLVCSPSNRKKWLTKHMDRIREAISTAMRGWKLLRVGKKRQYDNNIILLNLSTMIQRKGEGLTLHFMQPAFNLPWPLASAPLFLDWWRLAKWDFQWLNERQFHVGRKSERDGTSRLRYLNPSNVGFQLELCEATSS